ncbi:MAG: ATP phosphoribosyltransferase regulatory subunit [Rhodocyclaceae bacterium]|nr:ATP phosphoribosyltransferase regulatory subunit [Rhodocyclaceae bacterium]
MHRWLLPEAIEDVLPREAKKLEALRRSLLDAFRLRGYDLVIPPLLEYLDSLLIGSGSDLNLRTFKLVDQLSGRTLGIRADITPQVARMDAHLLNREGVTRLCYFGSVLHALPAGFTSTREPLQIGAEIYGHGGLEADLEIIRLLGESLALSGVQASRLDLGHVGVFKALADLGGIAGDLEQELLAVLQAKDVPGLKALVEDVAEPVYSALMALPGLYGGPEVLDRAQAVMPRDPRIQAALDDLRGLAAGLTGLPVSFDLADLRGYHYHSGIVFAAYCGQHPGAIALGGRYDEVGQAFGRGRPATGFSMDMREILRLLPVEKDAGAILAPLVGEGLDWAVAELRRAGEAVVPALPGHEGSWREAGCDRQLVKKDDLWVIVPLAE